MEVRTGAVARAGADLSAYAWGHLVSLIQCLLQRRGLVIAK